MRTLSLFLLVGMIAACAAESRPGDAERSDSTRAATAAAIEMPPLDLPPDVPASRLDTAIFAGGCFWCMEPPFDTIPGVLATISGYSGGKEANPTYPLVSAGKTGHAEVVMITYDTARVDYARLLHVYWRNTDPTVTDQQFCDHGHQYRPEIFVRNAEQRRLAEASKQDILSSGKVTEIRTPITDAGPFWPAEEYHQDFYKKNPDRYYSYREGCGRDRRLKELWN